MEKQNNSILAVENLQKYYGKTKAVDSISFQVYKGEIFGMLGPNGAGKTTTIECIEGLRNPDQGSIDLLGFDPSVNINKLKERIGIQLQNSQLQDRIKVWETVDFYASLYPKSVSGSDLLKSLGLYEKKDEFFSKLSGGQKQRLFIALALINDPEVVFLDELTTGLDPQARRAIWELILEIRSKGKTIFLSTHFMDEAEYLCDRLAIMDHGQIIALDTPKELINQHCSNEQIVFTAKVTPDLNKLKELDTVTEFEQTGNEITITGSGKSFIVDTINYLANLGVEFESLKLQKLNLEDVFLKLTGKEMRS